MWNRSAWFSEKYHCTSLPRLVHPVAIAEDGPVDPLAQAGVETVAIGHAAPQQRHQDEIGAVVAVLDGRQRAGDHRVGCGTVGADGEPRQRPHRIGLRMVGDFVERLVDPRRQAPQAPRPGARAWQISTPKTRDDREAADGQRHLEMPEVGGKALGVGDGQARLARRAEGNRVAHGRLDRHEVALDLDGHVGVDRKRRAR